MKFLPSSTSIQWDSRPHDIFNKVLSGTAWLSRSHYPNHEVKQPLLDKHRNKTFSFNEHNYYNGLGKQAFRQNPSVYNVSKAWPPSFHSYLLPTMEQGKHQQSVSISEVCRTATPLLPPVRAEKGVSWIGAAFLLINAALGIGILNFPAAYNQAGGILSATIVQICLLVFIVMTMLILAHCSDVNTDVTYHDVLMSMCGSLAQKLAALSIMCTCYGVGVAVLIVIGDQMDRLLISVFEQQFCSSWFLDRRFTVTVASLCLVLPMCYCKRVDFLRYTGSVGIFAMLYPVFLTVYGYFALDVKNPVIKTHPDNLSQFCGVIPVLCLAYQCQEVTVPVYSCLKERNITNFTKSCLLSIVFLVIIYSIIGCFGYLTFGDLVQPNVMKMYDAKDPVVMVGVGALILKMIVTYPVLALCGRGAVDGLYSELRCLTPEEFIHGEKKRRMIIASLWFGSSLLLALHTSSIGIVIDLLSSVTAINVFVYPGICLIKLVLKKDDNLLKWKSKFLVAGGILLAAIGTFCFGVVLFNVILGNRNVPPVDKLCKGS